MIKLGKPVTKMIVKNPKVIFTIPHFKEIIFDKKESQQSAPVTFDFGHGNLTWALIVFSKPAGPEEDDICYAKLRLLKQVPVYARPFVVAYNFGLRTINDSTDIKTDVIKTVSSDLVPCSGNEIKLFSRRDLMLKKSRYFEEEDAVTIVCHITEADTKVEDKKATHLTKMLDEGMFADVSIITADKKAIRAHKLLLARSPVFAAMFRNEMKEQNSDEIHVGNFSHEVMRELISYMYTDQVKVLEPIAGDLLIAADYYQLLDLKEVCTYSLESNVTFSNFTQSFYIAEKFGIRSLRDAVLRFIRANRRAIQSTTGWEEMKANKELFEMAVAALLDNSF